MNNLTRTRRLLCVGRCFSHQYQAKHPWITDDSPLQKNENILTILAANTAAGNLSQITTDWSYLDQPYHKIGIEVVLQTHLNVGFPRVINALATLREFHKRKFETEWSDLIKFTDDPIGDVKQKGKEAMSVVYGEQVYDKLQEKMNSIHPELAAWTQQYGYGTVLCRKSEQNIIDIVKIRELCTVSALCGMNVSPQLVSHIRGSLRAGATREQVEHVINQTHLIWGDEAQEQAHAVWCTFDRARGAL
ncbi:hypothetical protein AKO1_002618 [Acrasis kona]|uniref:Carboxymuconolactone decarboxylase-like domain-containing protein n=1 Tax=Acrasis kona TaxID=1008807 RepID=A0AAW2ZP52_9EUKA